MKKTILITGSTDGIGLVTAREFLSQGHRVLLHGRNREKLDKVVAELSDIPGRGGIDHFVADLSTMNDVDALADAVLDKYDSLDVLINNAGIFKTAHPVTSDGLDVRFVVNTLAPYRLTQRLSALIGSTGRVINLSSAAQAPVNLAALSGDVKLDAMDAYAQSKLAITMWSFAMAKESDSPVIIAVNPGSLLASKMVKEGFGVAGSDLGIGAKILSKASLDDDFANRSGQYFDNDAGSFGPPHQDALDPQKCAETVRAIESVVSNLINQ